jgi:GAF domain-containing protein
MNAPKQPLRLEDIAAVLAAASDRDPQAACRAVDGVAQRVVGYRLFTVMRYIDSRREVERVHSSDPAAYPVGGRKQREGTRWGEIVLDRGEVFLAPDRDALRQAFPDHELIFSLGISAILNVPIRSAGRSIGTMNLCGDTGQYGESDFPAARILAGLLVPVVLDRWVERTRNPSSSE